MLENKIFLEAGKGILTKRPGQITTVLGSCLAITMFNKKTGTAGISHSMFPSCEAVVSKEITSADLFNYVDCSFNRMINFFNQQNVGLDDIEIKVFGGGEVLEANYENFDSIGTQNIKMFKKIINDNNVKIKAADIGGKSGRKIVFNTSNGSVFVKKLDN